jgi:hypothetical protein
MTALAASTIRRPVILMFVEIFKIEVIVFGSKTPWKALNLL